MLDIPRLLICAPSSGSGKTTITCGILQLLADRGCKPAAFKCGPDYIDPQFHRRVVGVRSGNLDTFFTDDATTCALLARGAQGCGIAVMESAMGYYDGVAGIEARGSGYDVARATRTPAILVVDARGASLSLAATVGGFVRFAQPSFIAGVILNRCSKGVHDRLRGVIEERTGVPVVGYVPRDDRFGLQSRHLGLVGADEVADLRAWLRDVADALSQTVDVDALVRIAGSAPALDCEPYRAERACGGVRLAVAHDEAFNFYYAENLRMLQDLGAELEFFSPLHDERLPEGADGLYLGGGYPELHARELAENEPMRAGVRAAVESGLPTVAECGGFLYLQRELEDPDGAPWPMVGALPGRAGNLGKLRQFGFVEVEAQRDCLCCAAGEAIRAHEFHYWHSDAQGDAFIARKPASAAQWPCIVATETLMAGFPHAYYPANPAFARRFVEAMARRRAQAAVEGLPAMRRRRRHEGEGDEGEGGYPMRDRRSGETEQERQLIDGLRAALAALPEDDAEGRLNALVAGIVPVDEDAARRARENWDALAKPLDGLGMLEDAVCRLAAAQGDARVRARKRMVAVFCADNGVVAQGVSQSGPEVTTSVARGLCERSTSVCVMSHAGGCLVAPVDVGMLEDVDEPGLLVCKTAHGTGDISAGPAMSRDQAAFAMLAGARVAMTAAEAGVDVLLAGEMGIANTTTSAAVACALLNGDPERLTGRGAGLSSEGLARKVAVVRQALSVNAPDSGDALDVVAKVGGFDIAAMCGFYLGAAASRRPAILDGFISCVAALCAQRIASEVGGYLLASHVSAEPAASDVLEALGLQAPIHARLHLGEGTGAVALLPLIDLALAVYGDSRTFETAGMDAYEHLS